MSWLLAHQGGWDELLLFGAPIVLAFLVIRYVEKRGNARRPESNQEESASQNSEP